MAQETKQTNHGEHLGWELGVDFPLWANTEVYVKTISAGYLFENEKPKDAYWRVSTTVARRLNKPELATKFFDYIWKGWLNLASPVAQAIILKAKIPIIIFPFTFIFSKTIITTNARQPKSTKGFLISPRVTRVTG